MYTGKILYINLTDDEIYTEDTNYDDAENFVGGRGYAAKLLYDTFKPKTDSFSEHNKILFFPGPLTGIAVSSGRFSVTSKSPLTNTIFSSNSGGNFGIEIKRAGYDGIVIYGSAKKPTILRIDTEKTELLDGKKFWHKNISSVSNELSKYGSVAAIGIAGENKVRFANIAVDCHRHVGRGGLGALMGAKNLKAIVIKGSNKLEPANKYAFAKYNTEFVKILTKHPITGDGLKRFGTLILMNVINKIGALPGFNFKKHSFDVERISGEYMRKYFYKYHSCPNCTIGCGRIGKFGNLKTSGPEYESTWALGPNIGIFDEIKIALANNLCNEYGLDTISTGATIAFMLDSKLFGNSFKSAKNNVLKFIDKIAFRKDIGDELAEGTKKLAEKYNLLDYAMQVKGLDLPAYDPRVLHGQGLAYCTSSRGRCHLNAYIVQQEALSLPRYVDPSNDALKPQFVKKIENIYAMLDSLVTCKFTSFAIFSELDFKCDIYQKLLTAATGFYYDSEKFCECGERIFNIERCFNVREGFSANDDLLPEIFSTQAIEVGPAKGNVVNIVPLRDEYYRLRGWSMDGIPEERTLTQLVLQPLITYPKLQVALDLRDANEALRIAKLVAEGGADWIEAGTPLIKSAGIDIIRKLRQIVPNKTIVADLKTLDTGYLEVELAALAGADIVCIAGIADDFTIRDAIGAGKKYNVKIMTDLISVKEPIKRGLELEKLGVDYIEYHISVDKQLRADYKKIPFPEVKKLSEVINIPIALAGGLRADTAKFAIQSGAKIIVVGSAITCSGNPKEAVKNILASMGRKTR